MSIKITGDAEEKKYMYKKNTLTYKKKNKPKAQIIGLDGESKSNENVFCC
jgi:hypothetical protein